MTTSPPFPDRRLSVAPMLDWTDRHARVFFRCLTQQTLLYSEMVTTGAILYGDKNRFLGHSRLEHPLALQLGGSNPNDLARCAAIAEEWGYDEINLNVGCPSARVSSGRFGACLMAEPELVASCVYAMRQATSRPITVKHRIGIDTLDSEENLHRFVTTVANAGCRIFIVHARKAWLSGLSPKENRETPPLRYDIVYRLKKAFPELTIVLNGGLKNINAAIPHWNAVDGVMIGRAAYETPYSLAEADHALTHHAGFPPEEIPSRATVIARFRPYIVETLTAGVPLSRITRHILGLYHGQPNGKLWRRLLSTNATKPDATIDVLDHALEAVENPPAPFSGPPHKHHKSA